MSDADSISRLELPYKNLVLTGFLGVGKSTIGRHIVKKLTVDFLDIDEEIELRELMSIAKLREVYGDSRLRSLEYELCRQGAMMRRAVVVVPGAALLDERSYLPLSETGFIVCLTCELGEAMRRMHLSSEQHFRDPVIRRRMLSRLRREREIVDDPRILQLNTTHLTIEEEAELLISLWKTGKTDSPLFRVGPPERMKPPARNPVGLASRSSQPRGKGVHPS
jgi:shikimate kinase